MSSEKSDKTMQADRYGEDEYSPPTRTRWVRWVAQCVVASIVTAAAIFGATVLINTKPTAKKRKGRVQRTAPLVKTQPVGVFAGSITVDASGTVRPSREVTLQPEVGGRVVRVHPKLLPGGRVLKGEEILKIDDRPYALSVAQMRSELVKARADVRLEKGNQDIAKREYAFLGAKINKDNEDLVLRKPQLMSIQASARQAQARLSMAQLDLERTSVKAPFDAIIRTQNTYIGSNVNTQSVIANLVGIDVWWIEASVPVSALRWMKFPKKEGEKGSRVRVFNTAVWGKGVSRVGHILQRAADLEEKGRMARVLIAVQDPLVRRPEHAKLPELLLGSWVELAVESEPIESALVVDRAHVRDGDHVWVLQDGKLAIRTISVLYRNREKVFVSEGLKEGDEIITSALPTPVEGMELRTADTEDTERRPKKEKGMDHTGGKP